MTIGRWWQRYLGQPVPEVRVPKDLAHRIARLALAARTRLGGRWGGAYRAAFRGEGLEFAGVREYQPGDDTRAVDWRVWARTGNPAVRRYEEERDRRVWLLVDVGADSECGSASTTLRAVAAEVAAALASVALAAGDRVGLLAWSWRREVLLPPRRDRTATVRLVRSLLEAPVSRQRWNAAAAMDDVRRLAPRPAVVAVVAPRLDSPEVAAGAAILARRHQLLLVRTWDPRAGLGDGTGLVPARADGRLGGALGGPPPTLPPLPGLVATVLAGTDAAPALARALAPLRETRRAW